MCVCSRRIRCVPALQHAARGEEDGSGQPDVHGADPSAEERGGAGRGRSQRHHLLVRRESEEDLQVRDPAVTHSPRSLGQVNNHKLTIVTSIMCTKFVR